MFGNSIILFKFFQRSRTPNQQSQNQETRQGRHHYQSSMTAMLCTLNTVFFITTLPISIYNIGYTYWYSTTDPHVIAKLELWWSVVNMLMYTNNAVNFILYSLSGSRFRKELKHVMCRIHDAADTAFIALQPMEHCVIVNNGNGGNPLNHSCSIQTNDVKQRTTLDTTAVGSQNIMSSNTCISVQILTTSHVDENA